LTAGDAVAYGPRPLPARTLRIVAAIALSSAALLTASAQAVTAPRSVRAGVTRLGRDVVVELDSRTGTPRAIQRLGGFLTGRSSADPALVARHWIAAHAGALGLGAGDLPSLVLGKRTVSPAGVTHLTYVQTSDGIRAFNGFVRVNVARGGQIVDVAGSPLPDLRAPATTPRLSAAQATAAARRDAGGRASAAPVRTQLTLYGSGGATHLAWFVSAIRADAEHEYLYLVDALDGHVLWRENIVEKASGTRFLFYPSSLATAAGGTTADVAFPAPWLSSSATVLSGPNAHAYSDVNDDNVAESGEEVAPNGSGPDWNYPITADTGGGPFGCGTPASPCTWDSTTAFSWQTNRKQITTQDFFYVNNFHDWLEQPAIGFTPADGNFEGADPVHVETDDGATTTGGGPDGDHLDNANMATPPDPQSPRMQMYLFAGEGDGGNIDLNGGDDASVVYHEYTHGLSSRLITFANGAAALGDAQSGAMGEAWSDWYAMDYLFAQGLDSGPVNVGFFANGSRSSEPFAATVRTEPMNCRPGAATTTDGADDCHRTDGTAGGYTYADFGRILGVPDVHADGEIWGQTLWQIRETIGAPLARLLITEGMRLSPPEPSMLDERNAILAADRAAGTNRSTQLWQVFASRGMGVFASTTDANDTNPQADFHTPPPAPPTAGGPTTTPPPAPPARVAPRGAVSFAHRTLGRALSGGVLIRLRADRSAKAQVTVALSRALGRRLRLKKAAGKATVTLTAGRTRTVRLRLRGLSRRMRARLRNVKSVKLSITVELTDQTTGATTTVRRTVRLKR
jgi:extracellular elastinolytic metalloproteinase